ncbi:MAG: hypothetical protein ABW073_09490 [Acidimicrobiia bacterium]
MSEIIDAIPVIACSDIEAEHNFLVEVLGFESQPTRSTASGSTASAILTATIGGSPPSLRRLQPAEQASTRNRSLEPATNRELPGSCETTHLS